MTDNPWGTSIAHCTAVSNGSPTPVVSVICHRFPLAKVEKTRNPPGARTRRHSQRKREGELNHCTVEAEAIRSNDEDGTRMIDISASVLRKQRIGPATGA